MLGVGWGGGGWKRNRQDGGEKKSNLQAKDDSREGSCVLWVRSESRLGGASLGSAEIPAPKSASLCMVTVGTESMGTLAASSV